MNRFPAEPRARRSSATAAEGGAARAPWWRDLAPGGPELKAPRGACVWALGAAAVGHRRGCFFSPFPQYGSGGRRRALGGDWKGRPRRSLQEGVLVRPAREGVGAGRPGGAGRRAHGLRGIPLLRVPGARRAAEGCAGRVGAGRGTESPSFSLRAINLSPALALRLRAPLRPGRPPPSPWPRVGPRWGPSVGLLPLPRGPRCPGFETSGCNRTGRTRQLHLCLFRVELFFFIFLNYCC